MGPFSHSDRIVSPQQEQPAEDEDLLATSATISFPEDGVAIQDIDEEPQIKSAAGASSLKTFTRSKMKGEE